MCLIARVAIKAKGESDRWVFFSSVLWSMDLNHDRGFVLKYEMVLEWLIIVCHSQIFHFFKLMSVTNDLLKKKSIGIINEK